MAVPDLAKIIVAVTRDAGASLRAMRRNIVLHSAAPPTAGLVLDLGSGAALHPRADVVVDKYVADDFERATTLDLAKPLVVADGHALPFADGTFSYVIASHVLEHATDVRVFAGEMSRVAAAGFVQVPSREAELTFGWPFHPWLIDLEDGVLVFRPRGEASAPAGDFFHRAYAESPLFELWWNATRGRWHYSVHWQQEVPVDVQGSSAALATASLDVELTLAALAKMNGHGPTGSVREALRCPADGGRLADTGGALICDSCGLSYPQTDTGVPPLVAEAASPS